MIYCQWATEGRIWAFWVSKDIFLQWSMSIWELYFVCVFLETPYFYFSKFFHCLLFNVIFLFTFRHFCKEHCLQVPLNNCIQKPQNCYYSPSLSTRIRTQFPSVLYTVPGCATYVTCRTPELPSITSHLTNSHPAWLTLLWGRVRPNGTWCIRT